MLYSGIDLHRHSIAICTVNESGMVVSRTSMRTQPELVIADFGQWTEAHRAVVECTTGWYWLCDLLRSHGVPVVLAHAKYLKAISYAKVKTDAVEAELLTGEKDIREAAILYAESKPAAIHWGVPIDMTPAVTPSATPTRASAASEGRVRDKRQAAKAAAAVAKTAGYA
jgi:hypothetical protein